MEPVKILVAEDDAHIRLGLVDTLESEGYTAMEAKDGKEAISLFEKEHFDLVLLDIMMPEKSGYDVCRHIRAKNQDVSIIMLTAKSEEIDKVVGLQLGSDDYITKPFGVHELLARISAVLRRSNKDKKRKQIHQETKFIFGNHKVHSKNYTLLSANDGKLIDLSDRELKLIVLFYKHPKEVLSRDLILNEIWGIEYLGTTRTLDQHIANLRKKIEIDPSNPKIITTVHGVGYRYEAKETQ
ncbi:MAG: response regulator transcription factor [Desulfobacteraceae bacterium]|nr:response regulator transcription factor [Desulfobacteraceae bacterium]